MCFVIFLLVRVPAFLATGNNRKTLVPHSLPLSDQDLRFRGHFWGEKQEAGAFTLPFIDYLVTPLYSASADAPLSFGWTLKNFLQVIAERKFASGPQWGRGTVAGAEGWLLTKQSPLLFCQARLWLPEACSPHLWGPVPGNAFSLNAWGGFLFFHSLVVSALGIWAPLNRS